MSYFSPARILLPMLAISLFAVGTAPAAEPATYQGVDGKPAALPVDAKATVLVFVAHECPISNRYAPDIGRLWREFSPQGVAFRVVYAESDLALEVAAKHAEDYAYPCPAILDSDLRLARKVGATVTPEAAVLSPDGAVLYLGRIDDIYADYGKRRAAPTTHDLHDALTAVLAGEPVKVARTKSLGCYIYFGDAAAE